MPEGFFEWAEAGKVPVLGICYGMQLLVHALGGRVEAAAKGGEYGRMAIRTTQASHLYADETDHTQQVWMSHGDEAVALPDGFTAVATSDAGAVVAIEHPGRRLYGLQYHPEVAHSERGGATLERFLFGIAGVPADWRIESVLDEEMAKIAAAVGPEDHVICALSGGVDSTVAATLVHKVVGDRLHCVFVDNGLLRLDEADRVMATFSEHLHLPVTKVDASERMMERLKGVTDPEAKRKAIGAEFIACFDAFAKDLKARTGAHAGWLVQGTLYPDVIESCPPPGSGQKHSHTIKSHHNVGGLPADLQFKLIEPLRELFKVRGARARERGRVRRAHTRTGKGDGTHPNTLHPSPSPIPIPISFHSPAGRGPRPGPPARPERPRNFHRPPPFPGTGPGRPRHRGRDGGRRPGHPAGGG